ncbi:unnamed protein product [Miscanthus lutarioriparius]|uniref:Uncharacterized protein n=1 Tax=Miscanthus lutarioriparius TaxID=422564 RepID=A0A811MZZ0_9POAL|nr:unnamed protein product [Miscanthus lutarioriparius]
MASGGSTGELGDGSNVTGRKKQADEGGEAPHGVGGWRGTARHRAALRAQSMAIVAAMLWRGGGGWEARRAGHQGTRRGCEEEEKGVAAAGGELEKRSGGWRSYTRGCLGFWGTDDWMPRRPYLWPQGEHRGACGIES